MKRGASCRGGILELDRRRCSAADTVTGSLRGVADAAAVELIRVERHKQRRCGFTVARAAVSRPAGRFALAIPAGVLPTAAGRDCSVHYLVEAGHGRDAPCAELVVEASARPHLDTGPAHLDRLLSSWDARHFHIELAEADLTGGGRLGGRVHRHGAWPPGPLVVRARCLEVWRTNGPGDPRLPQWRHAVLWERKQPVPVDPDAHWAPFCFELPDELPPAVEGTTLAWRYEVLAERGVRHWFNETAALTPLLHEDLVR
jgi:hypothetical protein